MRIKLLVVAVLMDGYGVLWILFVFRWFICLFVDILFVEVSGAYGSFRSGSLGSSCSDVVFVCFFVDGVSDLGLFV